MNDNINNWLQQKLHIVESNQGVVFFTETQDRIGSQCPVVRVRVLLILCCLCRPHKGLCGCVQV